MIMLRGWRTMRRRVVTTRWIILIITALRISLRRWWALRIWRSRRSRIARRVLVVTWIRIRLIRGWVRSWTLVVIWIGTTVRWGWVVSGWTGRRLIWGSGIRCRCTG